MEIVAGPPLVGRPGIPRSDAGDQRPLPSDNGLQPICGQPEQYLRSEEDRAPVQRRKDILVVAGGWWLVVGARRLYFQPPATNHQSPTNNHQSPIKRSENLHR